MLISAATCAIGLVRQRSTSRFRPSGVSGAFLCVMLSAHRADVAQARSAVA